MGTTERAGAACQAAPDEPGLWWRREGNGVPVLCKVRTYPRRGSGWLLEAFGVESYRSYPIEPHEGVTWAPCDPPVGAS